MAPRKGRPTPPTTPPTRRPPTPAGAWKREGTAKRDGAHVAARLDVEARRAQLVDLGLEEFGQRAYDDVSIDRIAAAAGISKGLLYHYFPTKRAFYAATVHLAAQRLLDVVTAATPDHLSPIDRLHAGLDAYLTYVHDHARAYAALMQSGVGMDPQIARIVDDTRSTFLARLMRDLSSLAAASPEPDGAPRSRDRSPSERSGGRPHTDQSDLQRDLEPTPSTPWTSSLVHVVLRGWVGLVEAASLAWVASESTRPNANAHANTHANTKRARLVAKDPSHTRATKAEVRQALAASLVALVDHTRRAPPTHFEDPALRLL